MNRPLLLPVLLALLTIHCGRLLYETAECANFPGRSYCQKICPEGDASCSLTAQPSPIDCGNGKLDEGEQCDDGNTQDGDGCSHLCRYALSISAVVAGEVTCILTDFGHAKCWGDNRYGQLGLGHTQPMQEGQLPSSLGFLPLGAPATKIATAGSFVCALLAGGSVKCWGINDQGQLGQGHTRTLGDDEPLEGLPAISLGEEAMDIGVGQSHACALLRGGGVRCWGDCFSGQGGQANTADIGDDELPSMRPTIDLGGTAVALAVGGSFSCAKLETGELRCWGWNGRAQLGYSDFANVGDDEFPSSRGPVLGVGQANGLTLGRNHACVPLDGGTVKCWGENSYRQLGVTSPLIALYNANALPLNLGGAVVQVAASGSYTCVLLADQQVKCWGESVLGYGSVSLRTAIPALPVISIGGDAKQLSVGGSATCVLLTDGSLRCWGGGARGNLGQGNTESLGDDELPSDVPPIEWLPP